MCDNEASPRGAINTTEGSDHKNHLMKAGALMANAKHTQCTILDCTSLVYIRGWCVKHYSRWLRHGDPHYLKPIADDRTRFEAFTDRGNDCHRWTGSHNNKGYGWFRYQKKLRLAHVVAVLLDGQTIPEKMTVDHVWDRGCRHKDCVRIDHLEVVTMRANILRSNGFSALNARKTHCSRGHVYAGENLWISKRGDRVCRTCRRIARAPK